MNENKYLSRKFIVTILTIGCTTILAAYSKVDPNVAIVFGAAIASYNIVNGWVSKDGR